MNAGPHANQPLLRAGPTATTARHALILFHGRGGNAEQMISLTGAIGVPDVAAFAPAAHGNSWWPTSFLAPTEELEPWLSSALASATHASDAALEEGFNAEQLVLLGFSQGGCLALEAAARRGGPLGGIIALSAGLVGRRDAPERAPIRGYRDKDLTYETRLDGVPAYISCHTEDPHIPLQRVEDTGAALQSMGADTEVRLKQGSGHGFDAPDISAARKILA